MCEFCETNDVNRFSVVGNGESRAECGVSVFIFGLCVLECGGCRGRNGIRRRGRGGTFLFFGCWKGRESVGLGLGGWKSDVIGRFFRGFFWHIGWNVVPLRLFLNEYKML